MIKKAIKPLLYVTFGIAIIVLASVVYFGKMVVDTDIDVERDLTTSCNTSIGAPPNIKLISLLERVESGGIFEANSSEDQEKLARWWKCMRISLSQL